MALELQNDEQQRVMSDNLSISASNRLAAGNLSTQKSVQRVTDDVGAGIDGSGVAKSLTKGYSVAKRVNAAGVGTFLSGEAGRTAQFASEKAQPLRDAVSAVRGFTPSAVTGEAAASDSVAATAKWLPGNNFEKIASRPFVNNDFASAAKGVTPEAGIAPSLAVAGDDAAMSVGDMASAGGKLLGVAGGAYDAVEDIAHGGIYGANDYEKASNVLTIASRSPYGLLQKPLGCGPRHCAAPWPTSPLVFGRLRFRAPPFLCPAASRFEAWGARSSRAQGLFSDGISPQPPWLPNPV